MKKLSLFFALALASINSHSTPIYFLMEGTVLSSEVCCGYGDGYPPSHVGQTFKREVIWDDQYMFGADADSASQKTLFGNVGFNGYTVTETSNGTGGYTSVYNSGSHYFTKAGQYYFEGTSSNTGPSSEDALYGHSLDWSLQLITEKNLSGDKIIFNYSSTANYGFSGQDSAGYQFEFSDPSGAALKSNLLEFNWNAATSGAGSGIAASTSNGGRGGYYYIDNRTVQLTRLVLSYNPADLTPVPVPATIWLMGSALLGLFGLGCRKI